MQKSAGAILAKVRTKYGRRLNVNNYRDMAALHSVSEVAAYLDSRTRYSSALSTAEVHRAQLEGQLRRVTLDDVDQLMRFERSVSSFAYENLLIGYEAEELMRYMRYLTAGHPEHYSPLLGSNLLDAAAIDLAALSTCDASKLDSLIDDRRLLSAVNDCLKSGDMAAFEASVELITYRRKIKSVERHYSAQEQADLKELINLQAEANDVVHILRDKHRFGTPPTLLSTRVCGARSRLKQTEFEALINAPDYSSAMELLAGTKIGRLFEQFSTRSVEQLADRLIFSKMSREMHYSTYPAVVMMCYIGLMNYEIRNITTVIEGVRYGQPVERIMSLLVI